MREDPETRKLRALIERPERCEFWGQPYTITPRLIAEKFGDGQKLACIEPVMTRPNYFVARVDSATKSVDDPWPESLWGRTDARLLDVIMDAQVDEYGDRDGSDDYQWPIVDWDSGCSWSDPFPISEWVASAEPGAASKLTRRSRRFIVGAFEHHQAEGGLWRPCPRTGDLRVLIGLCKRGLMRVGDELPGFIPETWPRDGLRITKAGQFVAEEIIAAHAAHKASKTPT